MVQPQGRTAWELNPTLFPPMGKKEGYLGYPAMQMITRSKRIVALAFEKNWQLLAPTQMEDAAMINLSDNAPPSTQYGNERPERNSLSTGNMVRMESMVAFGRNGHLALLISNAAPFMGRWHKQIYRRGKRK